MKRFFQIQLKAGALQYAIFVSVIIALLITALISSTYLHQKLAIKSNFYLQCIESTNEVFRSLSNYPIAYDIPFSTQLDHKTISIKNTHWGILDYVEVTTSIVKETFEKTAFVGGKTNEPYALYLQDNKRPLVLVGETEINGKAYLPNAGVKRGNMGGHSYYGSQLIYGNTATSKSRLPKLLNRDYLFSFTNGLKKFAGQYINLNEKDAWVQSFKDTLLIHQSSSVIDISHKKLTGKMIIHSDTLIRVHANSQLQDVILSAPYIEILDGVNSSFQAIAEKNISVGKNVLLNYPSCLILIDNENSVKSSQPKVDKVISIDENSDIKGMVLYLKTEDKTANHETQILLATSSQITGEIYCEGNLDLKGRVGGTVYTNSFVAKEFGSIYQNHIYNGKINSRSLPKEYVGLPLKEKIPKVIQWAY